MIISKVVEKREEKKEKPFPKLMVDERDGQILFCTFIENERISGFALTKGSDRAYEVGKVVTPHMGNLSDFDGTIQLSNE